MRGRHLTEDLKEMPGQVTRITGEELSKQREEQVQRHCGGIMAVFVEDAKEPGVAKVQ